MGSKLIPFPLFTQNSGAATGKDKEEEEWPSGASGGSRFLFLLPCCFRLSLLLPFVFLFISFCSMAVVVLLQWRLGAGSRRRSFFFYPLLLCVFFFFYFSFPLSTMFSPLSSGFVAVLLFLLIHSGGFTVAYNSFLSPYFFVFLSL